MVAKTRGLRSLAESFAFLVDTILAQPLDGNIRLCFDGMGVITIDDLMDVTQDSLKDFGMSYTPTDTSSEEPTVARHLQFKALEIIKVLRIQKWYAHHEDPSDDIWASLTKADYDAWYKTYTVTQLRSVHGHTNQPDISTNTTPTSTLEQNATKILISNFQRGVKPALIDYSKLKDDK